MVSQPLMYQRVRLCANLLWSDLGNALPSTCRRKPWFSSMLQNSACLPALLGHRYRK